MVTRLDFPLIGNTACPVLFNGVCNQQDLICLFDTGAYLPVWCKDEMALHNVFPDAYWDGKFSLIGGFGEGYHKAKVFVIPRFELSDGHQMLSWANFRVVVVPKDLDAQIILPWTVFERCNISLNTYSTHTVPKVIIPHIIFKSPRKSFGIRVSFAILKDGSKVVNAISVLAQK